MSLLSVHRSLPRTSPKSLSYVQVYQCMQAFRDNERIAFQDQAFAQHLWQASGLAAACKSIKVDGKAAVSLNPNIRLYKQGNLLFCCTDTIFY